VYFSTELINISSDSCQQVSWDCYTSDKLHAIIPVVGSSVMKKSLNRRNSSVL